MSKAVNQVRHFHIYNQHTLYGINHLCYFTHEQETTQQCRNFNVSMVITVYVSYDFERY